MLSSKEQSCISLWCLVITGNISSLAKWLEIILVCVCVCLCVHMDCVVCRAKISHIPPRVWCPMITRYMINGNTG